MADALIHSLDSMFPYATWKITMATISAVKHVAYSSSETECPQDTFYVCYPLSWMHQLDK